LIKDPKIKLEHLLEFKKEKKKRCEDRIKELDKKPFITKGIIRDV
jgi:hypothetical protein